MKMYISLLRMHVDTKKGSCLTVWQLDNFPD